MLPGGSDPFYRRLLARSHRQYVRVEVWSAQGEQLAILAQNQGQPEGGLVILGGSITATLTNQVSRNATLEVPSYLYPANSGDLLDPFAHEIRIFQGVAMADGADTYTWQTFRGRVRRVEKSSEGTCSVECSDRAADIQDVNFVSPQNSNPTHTISEEWQRLILDALPDASFGASDDFAKLVESLTWEFERASALDEMARSVGALWYPLANGDFVLRRFPWNVNAAPVITLTDQPGGTVNRWSARRSRDSIYNVVTVTGERLNGDAPVFATASDSTPGSPTSTTGNFGVRSIVERLQNPSTQGGAQGAAEALLRTYIAPTEEWSLELVLDASQELGDVVTLEVDNRSVTQVITSIALPLGLTGDMSVSTRSLVLGGVL